MDEKMAIVQALSLERLLLIAREVNCADPRDKVFALLNIVRQRDMDSLSVVEYSISTSELYLRVREVLVRG